jgi:stearoyl-CoA desaturase (delta-9 desaturase)
MLGVSMSYHRQLSHKSFRCPKWLEYSLAYCGALAFEGDPIEWSKNHRQVTP